MSQQVGLRADPETTSLHALARWGADPFDVACLPGAGRLEIRSAPPDGAGRAMRALCLAPVLPEGFVLADRRDGVTWIQVPEDAQATLHAPGEPPRALEAGAAYPLGPSQGVSITVGAFEISLQHAPGLDAPGRRGPVDWAWMRVGAMSTLVHGFTFAAAALTPPSAQLSDGLHRGRWTLPATVKLKLEEKKPKAPAAKGLEEALRKGPGARVGPPKRARAAAPRSDREVAENAGLLRLLKRGGGAGSHLFDPGGGLDEGLALAMQGLRGARAAAGDGLGGMGTRGGRTGARGGSVGIGALGPRGGGEGGADIALGRRGKPRTRIVPGRWVLIGSLEKPEIRRVMNRNQARFRYCYEKELNAKPNLQGKVSVRFRILPDGSVARAEILESSAHDAALEGCLARVLGTLKFPKPRGGGVVVVTYPFIFAST